MLLFNGESNGVGDSFFFCVFLRLLNFPNKLTSGDEMLGFKHCRCWTFGGCTNMAPMGTGGENSTELTCQDQLAKLGGCFVSRSFGTDEGENGVGPNRRSGTQVF